MKYKIGDWVLAEVEGRAPMYGVVIEVRADLPDNFDYYPYRVFGLQGDRARSWVYSKYELTRAEIPEGILAGILAEILAEE